MSDADDRSGPGADGPAPGDAAPRHLLLTGRPAVGKTTVVRRLAGQLSAAAAQEEDRPRPEGGAETETSPGSPARPPSPRPVALAGFYTEEIRDGGRRRGFRAVTLPGDRRKTIAHEDIEGRPRVAAYGVDVDAVDALAEATLEAASDASAILIDEVGKMECCSDRFVEVTRELLEGRKPVVATVGPGGTEFMEELRRREDAELWRVTRENRDELPALLERELRKRLGDLSR